MACGYFQLGRCGLPGGTQGAGKGPYPGHSVSQSGGKRHLGTWGIGPCSCSKLHSGISFDPGAIDFFLAAFY